MAVYICEQKINIITNNQQSNTVIQARPEGLRQEFMGGTRKEKEKKRKTENMRMKKGRERQEEAEED